MFGGVMLEGALSAESPRGASSLMPAGMGLGLPALPPVTTSPRAVEVQILTYLQRLEAKVKTQDDAIKEFMNMQNEINAANAKFLLDNNDFFHTRIDSGESARAASGQGHRHNRVSTKRKASITKMKTV
jgi:hypothetical protein